MNEDPQNTSPDAFPQEGASSPLEVEAIWEALTTVGVPLDLETEGKEEVSGRLEVLVLALGDHRYGLPIEWLREILEVPDLTRVPRGPKALKGICSLRGQVLPVLDLGLCLGEEPASSRPGRIVALAVDGSLVGVLVDHVERVIRLDSESIHPAPPASHDGQVSPWSGMARVEDQLLPLLNVKALVDRACPIKSGNG